MATGREISLEGKAYSIDDFELGDLEWLEEHVGAPIMDEKTLTSMKTIVGFVYLIKRRDNPEFTLEDADSWDRSHRHQIGTKVPVADPVPTALT